MVSRFALIAVLVAGFMVASHATPSPTITMDVGVCDPNSPTTCLAPNADGSLPTTNSAGSIAAYSAATISQATAASATDVWCIRGSATKTVKIQGVRISGIASANTVVSALLVKRSTANSGGTSSAVTVVPHDSLEDAASATVASYSANPTLGTSVGLLRAENILFAGNSAPNLAIEIVVYQFSVYSGRVPTLRGTSESLCVNLNGQTVSGGAISVDAQWTEE